MVDRYGRAVQGQPQMVTLHGEAGIGKTRLAAEFLSCCRAEGAEVIQARAFESGSLMAFQPLVEALRSRLNQPGERKDLPEAPWMAPLRHCCPNCASTIPVCLPPGRFGRRTNATLRTLGAADAMLAGAAPLVRFMDDLQWADSATLEGLQYAARRWRTSGARVLLLLGVRAEALQPSANANRQA